MARQRVEKAPMFDPATLDMASLSQYVSAYGVTDEQGRYLHWSKLKWRLKVPDQEAVKIWIAIKFKRMLIQKQTELASDSGNRFTYCTPHPMEAKLHQVAKVAGGSVASIAGNAASDSIQSRYLVSSLIMEEAITSAQLEGAATTRADAKKMIQDEREPRDEDERMILNNYFLLKYAEQVAQEDLSIDMILEFHRIATQHTTENEVVPGAFRASDDIYVEDDQGGIAHQPPAFSEIPKRLQALCDFANTNHDGLQGNAFIQPVIKAIILHFMIGYEHPFRDGNGRTARALFYWYMLKQEYKLFKYISISKLLKEKPKDYGLSYLYTEKDHNDLTYFIDFQLDIILAAIDELQQYLQEKTNEFEQVIEILNQSEVGRNLNFIQKDIIKKGTKEPGRIFTAKEIASSYDIAENTARSYLKKLIDHNLLLLSKDGRTQLYIAPSDLRSRLGAS